MNHQIALLMSALVGSSALANPSLIVECKTLEKTPKEIDFTIGYADSEAPKQINLNQQAIPVSEISQFSDLDGRLVVKFFTGSNGPAQPTGFILRAKNTNGVLSKATLTPFSYDSVPGIAVEAKAIPAACEGS